MKYFAAAEVDQIQSIIFASDKLKEMIGASYLIDDATTTIENILNYHKGITLIWSVSGVYKFAGDNLNELAATLWEIREKLVYEQGLSVTFEILETSGERVTDIFHELDNRIRQQKDSRHGEDGSPSCPFFAPCRILADEYANFWDSKMDGKEQHHRRALVSDKANIRKNTEDGIHGLPFVGPVLPDTTIKLPEDFDALTVDGANDSYLAFIKGDGDGLGLLLSRLDWDDKNWEKNGCQIKPELRPLEFSKRVRNVFRDALKKAITTVTKEIKTGKGFPIVPLLLGGEDLWIMARRDLALPLVYQMGTIFSQKMIEDDFLKIAFQIGGISKITLSFGVLFAQKGYPFDQQTKLVNELLKNAKKYRKKLPDKLQEGCIDFLWLDTSGRETVEEMRQKAYGYKDNKKTFRLFSHPWTLTELQNCHKALSNFSLISRRKLYQWRNILRSGDVISVARAQHWYTSLETAERSAWSNGVAALPQRLTAGTLVISDNNDLKQGFWQHISNEEYMSSIQDLLELMEIGQCPSTKQTGVQNESTED